MNPTELLKEKDLQIENLKIEIQSLKEHHEHGKIYSWLMEIRYQKASLMEEQLSYNKLIEDSIDLINSAFPEYRKITDKNDVAWFSDELNDLKETMEYCEDERKFKGMSLISCYTEIIEQSHGA